MDDEMTGRELAELLGNRLEELLQEESEEDQRALMRYAVNRLEEAGLLLGNVDQDDPASLAYQGDHEPTRSSPTT
jgi:hypothetical protein